MQLRCPRCRSLVEVPVQLNRYFGMPVACHLCRHVFAVPPQNPLDDSALPHRLVGPLDRSVSAARCSHERACPCCQHRIRLPGFDPAIGPLALSCLYCRTRFTLREGGGIRPGLVAAAFGGGIVLGLLLLWLDHEGVIALRQLHAMERLVEGARLVRQWMMSIATMIS